MWILVGIVAIYWLLNLYAIVRTVAGVPRVADFDAAPPARWPRLTLIVPACNEAPTLEAAVRSRLADGYPDLEVVLIDDRSTDATGEIVDRLAGADPRVRAVHLTSLPPGWLGKLNAMHQGLQHATGDYVLFSDADVHLAPDVLARCVAWCEAEGVDHLAIFPQIWRHPGVRGFFLDVTVAAFTRFVCLVGRLWKVRDPRSSAFAGVGAFNLVRRSALDRTPGLAWLKLEVADDMALGQMLKAHGARSAIAIGHRQVALSFYADFGEAARSAEKSAAGFRYSAPLGISLSLLLLALELAPFLWIATPLGAALAACALVSSVLGNARSGQPILPSLLVPVGAVAFLWLMARGTWVTLRRGGLVWRGTRYELADLVAGQRLKMP